MIELVCEKSRVVIKGKPLWKFLNSVFCALVYFCLIGIIVSYGYQTYSTWRTLDLGDRHIKMYVQNALSHAIEDEKHTDDMPIVFVGYVNDREVQEWNPLSKYSYFDRAFPFWWDKYEVFAVWPKYCWYNYGIDIGNVTPEQYDSILASEEFEAMDDYPSKEAYSVIDGCYVILLGRGTVQK